MNKSPAIVMTRLDVQRLEKVMAEIPAPLEMLEALELTLVYPDQAGRPGTISVLAPVGMALIGLKVGQSINWQGPAGRPLRLKIIDVVYQPEANGDFHL